MTWSVGYNSSIDCSHFYLVLDLNTGQL